jgi:hypothetical protein
MARAAATMLTGTLDFGGETPKRPTRRGLTLATPLDRLLRGPDKYRVLDLKRRRAQIRARRELGLID